MENKAEKTKHQTEIHLLIETNNSDEIDAYVKSHISYIEKRLKQRGYNQSQEFALGLSKKLNIETNTTLLIRKEFTSTQTKKNKYERWENVEDVFEITNIDELKNKFPAAFHVFKRNMYTIPQLEKAGKLLRINNIDDLYNYLLNLKYK